MPSNSLWTADEDRLLRVLHAQGKSRDEMSAAIGRSESGVKTRLARLGLTKDRRFTDAEKQFVIDSNGTLTADQIATHLGRSRSSIHQVRDRLGLCDRQRDGRPLQEFIREKHPLGWSDAEVAAAWNAANPTESVSREWVTEVRRDKCGLPHNAYSTHRRQKVAEKTREQLAAAGVNSLAEVRRLAFDQFATRHGWPADLRPRAVQILDLLYQKGPHTREQIAEAIKMPWKGSRKSLCSNDPEGSYLAHLIARGLVVASKRAHKVHGQGSGKSCDVYAIAPHVTRGPICPQNEKTSA